MITNETDIDTIILDMADKGYLDNYSIASWARAPEKRLREYLKKSLDIFHIHATDIDNLFDWREKRKIEKGSDEYKRYMTALYLQNKYAKTIGQHSLYITTYALLN